MLFKRKAPTKLEDRPWWNYVHRDMRELLTESEILVENVAKWKHKFHDYAFVVFPAAKAYEGFLKMLFLDMGFITQEDFYGKRFRIGRALNPALEPRFREHESVYDKLTHFCHGEELPKSLWEMWKKGRNMSFHWFPDERNAITFVEAKNIVHEIFDTMDLAFVGCKMEKGT
jgi:hypothetical protein